MGVVVVSFSVFSGDSEEVCVVVVVAAVRAGGGYKKFTLKARVDGELVDASEDVEWSIDFEGNEDKLECSVVDNIFRVKCLPFYDLVGRTFTITAESEYSSKSLIVEVISL